MILLTPLIPIVLILILTILRKKVEHPLVKIFLDLCGIIFIGSITLSFLGFSVYFDYGFEFGYSVGVAFLFIFIGEFLTNLISSFLVSITITRFTPEHLRISKKIKWLVGIIIYLLVLLVILSTFGFDIYPLLAGLGIGGVALALASQNVLQNYLAGLIILSEKQFHVGDYVKINDLEGFISDISWRSVTLITREGNAIIIPNSKLLESIVINYYLPKESSILKIEVGISYEENLEKVEKILKKVAKKVQRKFDPTYKPKVYFTKFGDYYIIARVLIKVRNYLDYRKATHEFIKLLMKEDIKIPYPTITIN